MWGAGATVAMTAAELDRWDLDSGFRSETAPSPGDYSAAADGRSAVLFSAVPRPAGSAALVQTIFAEDYRGVTVVFRGVTVVFRGEVRTEPFTGQAELSLEVFGHRWRGGRAPARTTA